MAEVRKPLDLIGLLADPLPPRTVPWLDEIGTYLDGQPGEQAAAALRRVLASGSRVVVIGSMCPIRGRTSPEACRFARFAGVSLAGSFGHAECSDAAKRGSFLPPCSLL